MINDNDKESSGFQEIGVSPALLQILDARKITKATPIQHQAIPLGLQGKDLIGIAQTGTGKTLAFGLPLLEQLDSGKRRALILVPTRELAYQAEESLKPLASVLNIGIAVFVGGIAKTHQYRMLRKNPRILIATPGRLNDHLDQKSVTLNEVDVLVLDEADRMLDMGFKPQIDKVLSHIPKKRQTLLFSATMSQDIIKLATAQMQTPLRIEVAPPGTTAAKVEQEVIVVKQPDKAKLLQSLIRENEGQIIVFTRTKHGAKKVTRALNDKRIRAAEIHGNRTLPQRRAALEGFKKGKVQVLVATDIASRGIDVTGIALVINYDLPDDPADYVHRIGRTGRADKEGKAISFATPTQAKNIRDIEKLISTSLQRRHHESLPHVSMQNDAGEKTRKPRRGGKRPQGKFKKNNASKPGFSKKPSGFKKKPSGSRSGFKKKQSAKRDRKPRGRR